MLFLYPTSLRRLVKRSTEAKHVVLTTSINENSSIDMYASTKIPKEVIPAHLGFLAIYNPSLGTGDESVKSQITYYYSSHNREDVESSRVTNTNLKDNDFLKQQTDEQMRQVGLAQGIIEFGKSFTGSKPVKTIDTEKSRIVLHEFEPSWWILAVRKYCSSVTRTLMIESSL